MYLPHIETDDDTVIRARSTNFIDIAPVDYHSDGAFTFGEPVVRTLLIEVQRRKDLRKQFAWMQYIAALYAEHQAPVDLIVFAENASVARWARKPIDVGSGILWRPVVIGPEELAAQQHSAVFKEYPELVVLAMQICQGSEPIHQDVVTDTAQWLARPNELAEDTARLYRDIVRNAVSGVTRTLVEHIMSVSNEQFESAYFRRLRQEWNDEGREEGREEGQEVGHERGLLDAMTDSLLTFLNARGFELSDKQIAHIRSCSDPATLKEWIRKAATSASVEDALR